MFYILSDLLEHLFKFPFVEIPLINLEIVQFAVIAFIRERISSSREQIEGYVSFRIVKIDTFPDLNESREISFSFYLQGGLIEIGIRDDCIHPIVAIVHNLGELLVGVSHTYQFESFTP